MYRRSLSLHLALALLLAVSAMAVAGEDSVGVSSFVGAETCTGCHDLGELHITDNVHMRIESFEVRGAEVGCEGCHGPGSQHAEEGDPALIRTFADKGDDAVCVECHKAKGNYGFQDVGFSEWQASVHAAEGTGCLSCHKGHKAVNPQNACVNCHAEEVAQFQLPSHHPVREGKMACASCHNAHGATEFMLKTRMRKNDLCFTCHQDKEGPFIFQHDPVEEDCATCHQPHGTVANNLLVANEPMLCLQCHEFHFHAGYRSPDAHEFEIGGIERENPNGAASFNVAMTTNCTQCHAQVHGSDTPSQGVSNSGQGLIH